MYFMQHINCLISIMSTFSETLLRKYFPWNDFRQGQKAIVDAILSGRDIFGLLSTGAGKSACFQIPAMGVSGTCLVVCPLIALMKEQVTRLKKFKLPAECLHSHLDKSTQFKIEERFITNQLKLLYITPERLTTKHFQDLLTRATISFVVFDEAQLLTEWGDGFRPAYAQVDNVLSKIENNFRTKNNNPDFRFQRCVFSASIIFDARDTIKARAGLHQPKEFLDSFKRDNIFQHVIDLSSVQISQKQLVQSLINQASDGPSIIYVQTRKQCEYVSDQLNNKQTTAMPFHAGLPNSQRWRTLSRFYKGEINLLVCTSAFGLGIDNSNIQQVIHWDLPSNLESMYQEMGRAGRNGQDAAHYLLYHPTDLANLTEKVHNENPPPIVLKQFVGYLLQQCDRQSQFVQLDPGYIANTIGPPTNRFMIQALINHCIRAGILESINNYSNKKTNEEMFNYKVVPTAPRPDYEQINLQRKITLHKLDHLKKYILTKTCHVRFLLNYLGEPGVRNKNSTCHHCSSCVQLNYAPSDNTTKKLASSQPGKLQNHKGAHSSLRSIITTLRTDLANAAKVAPTTVLTAAQLDAICGLETVSERSLIDNVKLTMPQMKTIGKLILEVVKQR